MAADSHTKRAIQAQDLFKRAAEANLADQYRQGNLITFPPKAI